MTTFIPKMDKDLAYDNYESVRRNYFVSLMAAKLMLGNDHAKDQIDAHLQAVGGFDPKVDKSRLRALGDDLVDWANEESATDFQGIRRAYLVSACGALENLAKCCFVSWVNDDPATIERISARKLSVSLSEFVDGDRQERIFAAADRIFQDTGGRRHFQKFCTYVKPLIPPQNETELANFDTVDPESFDEAFMVRNRLVHHGARAEPRLAKAFGISQGESLKISRVHVGRYMRAIDAMACIISFATPPLLI